MLQNNEYMDVRRRRFPARVRLWRSCDEIRIFAENDVFSVSMISSVIVKDAFSGELDRMLKPIPVLLGF